MLGNISNNPVAKIAIVVIVILAIGAVAFEGFQMAGSTGEVHADPKEVQSDAQKQLEAIQKNPNLDPALKAQMIAHYQGMAQGRTAAPAAGGPPK